MFIKAITCSSTVKNKQRRGGVLNIQRELDWLLWGHRLLFPVWVKAMSKTDLRPSPQPRLDYNPVSSHTETAEPPRWPASPVLGEDWRRQVLCSLHDFILTSVGRGPLSTIRQVILSLAITASKEARRQGKRVFGPGEVGTEAGHRRREVMEKGLWAPSQGASVLMPSLGKRSLGTVPQLPGRSG